MSLMKGYNKKQGIRYFFCNKTYVKSKIYFKLKKERRKREWEITYQKKKQKATLLLM